MVSASRRRRKPSRSTCDGVKGEQVGELPSRWSLARKNNRPQLARALATSKTYGATLIIAKLDRLARNVHFISGLMESGVEFVAVDFPQANRLTVHILSSVDEHEAGLISARTNAALAVLKARGVNSAPSSPSASGRSLARVGGQASRCDREKARQRAADLLPVVEEIRARGVVTLEGIADELNRKGILAPRGGRWVAMQVLHLQRNAPAPIAQEVAA